MQPPPPTGSTGKAPPPPMGSPGIAEGEDAGVTLDERPVTVIVVVGVLLDEIPTHPTTKTSTAAPLHKASAGRPL